MHVRDVSNPDHVLQKVNVDRTLAKLRLAPHLRDSIIEIGNKVDKLDRSVSAVVSETFISLFHGDVKPGCD